MRKILALCVAAIISLSPAFSQNIDSGIGNPLTSLPPSGAAGGDLTGTYPNPSLAATITGNRSWNGQQTFTGGTVTVNAPVFNGTQTWNNSGITFTGIFTNITDTASAGNSKLMDLQLAGVSIFNVSKGGTASSVSFSPAATGSILWSGRSRITSPADSNILFANNAATAFSLLQFGGTTNSFPALKRNSAGLQVRVADDSADAALSALSYTAAGSAGVSCTVGTLNPVTTVVTAGIITHC